jgi:hypothetical protein
MGGGVVGEVGLQRPMHVFDGRHGMLEVRTHSLPKSQERLGAPIIHVGSSGQIHWPPHGKPVVDIIVGVQRPVGRQGVSLPIVHLVTGGIL